MLRFLSIIAVLSVVVSSSTVDRLECSAAVKVENETSDTVHSVRVPVSGHVRANRNLSHKLEAEERRSQN